MTGFDEASLGGAQILVTVAGMAHEFPSTFGQVLNDVSEALRVERTGGRDADRTIGGPKPRALDETDETIAQKTQRASLKRPFPLGPALRQNRVDRLERLEGIA